MATFQPIRNTKAVIDNTPIVDGQFLMTTDLGVNNEIYVDNGSTRELILKGINVDSELSTTSTNAIANNAITNSIEEKLNGYKFVQMTQAEYNALEVKNNKTIYMIVG